MTDSPRRPSFRFQDPSAPAPEPATIESPEERRNRLDREGHDAYLKHLEETTGELQARMAEKGKEFKVVPPPEDIKRPAPSKAPLRPDRADTSNPYIARFQTVVERLPSRALPYPPNPEITYRPYMFGELEYLEESVLSERDRYALLLEGITTSFPKEDLTLPDTMYLGLIRRIATMDAEVIGVDTKCPQCGGVNKVQVNTDELEFDELSIPALPVNVPFSFGNHSFRPVTIGDYLALIEGGFPLDNTHILAIQCHTMDFPESVEVFRTLVDPQDTKKAVTLDSLLHHNVAPISVTCVNQHNGTDCGKTYRAGLENVREAFIYPFRGKSSAPEDEITFGD